MISHAKNWSRQTSSVTKKTEITIAALVIGLLPLTCSCDSQVNSSHIGKVSASPSSTRHHHAPLTRTAHQPPQTDPTAPDLQGGSQGATSPSHTDTAPADNTRQDANTGETLKPAPPSVKPPAPGSTGQASGMGGDPGVPPVSTTASPPRQTPGRPGPQPAPTGK